MVESPRSELEQLKLDVFSLEMLEVLVETNLGTFSAADTAAFASPDLGMYAIFERVGDGRRRLIGCDPQVAPGRPQKLSNAINHRRWYLSELRQRIAELE